MKKLLFTALFALGVISFSFAQTGGQPMTKEQKAAAKIKKEQDLADSFKEAGFTKAEENKVRAILDDANEKSKELKTDDTLSEDEKAAKKEEINQEKNAKIKEVIGAEKNKLWNSIRKKQKEAAAVAQ